MITTYTNAELPETRLTLSVNEAAKRLGVSRSLTYELIRAGDLPAVRLRGRRLISVEALEQFVRQQADASN
jgi:excisionase family DNA binding protein